MVKLERRDAREGGESLHGMPVSLQTRVNARWEGKVYFD